MEMSTFVKLLVFRKRTVKGNREIWLPASLANHHGERFPENSTKKGNPKMVIDGLGPRYI